MSSALIYRVSKFKYMYFVSLTPSNINRSKVETFYAKAMSVRIELSSIKEKANLLNPRSTCKATTKLIVIIVFNNFCR